MKKITLLITLLLAFAGCEEEVDIRNIICGAEYITIENKIVERERAYVINKTYTGNYVEYFPGDEKIKCRELKYIDGLKEGKEIFYYYNGKIKKEVDYKKGFKHGEEKEYFEDEALKYKCEYKTGFKHGKEIKYYENHIKKFEIDYYKNMKHGKETVYYESEWPLMLTNYKFGKKEGIEYVYEDVPYKKVKYENFFKNNELFNGTEISLRDYINSEQLLEIVPFIYSEKHVEHGDLKWYKRYDSDMKMDAYVEYRNNEVVLSKRFNSNGDITYEMKKENGNEYIRKKRYHKNGVLAEEYFMVNGKVDGSVTAFDESGDLVGITTYSNGVLDM